MEFLWFIVLAVVARWAWTARRDARHAREHALRLQKELAALESTVASLQRQRAAPAAEMPAAPEAAPAAPPAAAIPVPAVAKPSAAPVPAMPAQHAPQAARTAVTPPAVPAAPVSPATPAAQMEPAKVDTMATPATASMSDSAWGAAKEAAASAPARPRPAPRPSQPPAWFSAARNWLFEGNLVAKMGLLILFIGVSFLLKYAAARVTVPIELRLAGIVLADVAALAWAWRIRRSHKGVSLPLQGTCMAVLMLVVFGAFRIYHLIPSGMAFTMLFLLTIGTCMLAVLQNAQWLAIFGIAGGFAAPILTSTGQGSHIALFTYYALLNAGILAIALKRSWRVLNLLGFVFTFAIGTAWGVLRYEPQFYQSVQGFLLLFFLYYVGIAIAYAHLAAPKLKSYVDGTLVFGTPMLAASLQFGLVKDFAFGMAYSTLALGLFYGALAITLARRRATYGLLVDAFTALAVVFGTLAIPMALDGRWTSAAWALEGAGIVWIGLRQRQPLAWGFGLLVQLGAWVSFIGSVAGLSAFKAMNANLWLGFLLLAASACFMAMRFRSHAEEEGRRGLGVVGALFLLGSAVWLLGGAWTEVILRTSGKLQADLLAVSAIGAAVVMGLIARRLAWPMARGLALATQLLGGLVLGCLLLAHWEVAPVSPDLFATPIIGSVMLLAGALFTAWALMRHGAKSVLSLSNAILAYAGMWWLLVIVPTFANWLLALYEIATTGAFDPYSGLRASAYILMIAATTPLFIVLAQRLEWPALRAGALPAWVLFIVTTLGMLGVLYGRGDMPAGEDWVAYAVLWLLCEWRMRRSALRHPALVLLHTVRTSGPWMMIWPVGAYWISRALDGGSADPAWANFLPAWLMMGALAWVMRRVRADGWPVKPVAAWYRDVLLPLGCAWSLLLVAVWNLTQDGAMAPLPYIPLANPLDLTSIFALLLCVAGYRMLRASLAPYRPQLLAAGALAAYAWFNLALLRTVSHYLGVPYRFEDLFQSQFVQAMLSLVWSVTALLLMRQAARKLERKLWIAGAVLLGVVVAKLFLVDLSNVGGVERIVSFLGVGALMVGIGYLAPYPSARNDETSKEAA
ncbi:DUF2339 domain-containing protein [Pseudoduganella violaceinigra]|uniref:DUF2339 domain-containing protein n=1 Tax=Pseudoduganella violaceinigra TaxID=246602 RepID=UPI00041BB8C0|nr:DUF2339 domain-containing protein [Pseudoduganella violaceinigra]